MKQVLDLPHAPDLPHAVLDLLDLLWIVELSAQDDDAAVSVDADLSLGNRPVPEQLGFHLADEADIVQFRTMTVMRDRVRETDDLPRVIVCLALDDPLAAPERPFGSVSSEVAPPPAAAWVEEELEDDPRGQTGAGDRSQLTYRAPARMRRPPASTIKQEAKYRSAPPPTEVHEQCVHDSPKQDRMPLLKVART